MRAQNTEIHEKNLRSNDHARNIYTTAMMKNITTMKDENERAKGVTLIIVNTGGASAFQEMMCDVTFATNRLHQIKMGKIQCHEEACPSHDKEASGKLASIIQIGRLLVKQGTEMSHERSFMTQSATFTTARNITSNKEQKKIPKDWKEEKEGATVYKKNKSDEIIRKAA